MRSVHGPLESAITAPKIAACSGAQQGGPRAFRGPPGHRISALVVIAVDLLKEGLGVECICRAGDAGDDRKRNKGGQDGLRDISPLISIPLQCGCEVCCPIIWGRPLLRREQPCRGRDRRLNRHPGSKLCPFTRARARLTRTRFAASSTQRPGTTYLLSPP
jgi:hypothetical protein